METTGNPPHAQYRRFESNREYETLCNEMIPLTLQTIRVFDQSLSRSWNEAARIELLSQFLRLDRKNRLLIVIHDARSLATAHPRLLTLLRQFSPAITIRETLRAAKQVYDPFMTFDASHYLHRFHYNHMRAAQGLHDVVGTGQLIDRFDALEECAGPPLAANVAGL